MKTIGIIFFSVVFGIKLAAQIPIPLLIRPAASLAKIVSHEYHNGIIYLKNGEAIAGTIRFKMTGFPDFKVRIIPKEGQATNILAKKINKISFLGTDSLLSIRGDSTIYIYLNYEKQLARLLYEDAFLKLYDNVFAVNEFMGRHNAPYFLEINGEIKKWRTFQDLLKNSPQNQSFQNYLKKLEKIKQQRLGKIFRR